MTSSRPESSFSYVPYQELDGQPNVIVDGSSADGTVLTLSHWPNSPVPPGLEADLSAEMAYMYLDRLDLHGDARAVSNNHFDQDGLVSMFALLHPEDALARDERLIELARAGDFAKYEDRAAARASMVVSAFADPRRSPVVSKGEDTSDYSQFCSLLYSRLLPRVVDLCDHIDSYRDLWELEDQSLQSSEKTIASGAVSIQEDPGLDLVVLRVPEDAPDHGGHLFAGNWRRGLHPMAIHNATDRFRVIVIRGQRFELYFRYESWVQYRSAEPMQRVDLAPLADELNSMEQSEEAVWKADKFSSISPELRLRAGADETPDSTLSPERFVDLARAYLEQAPPTWDPYAAATDT